MVSLKIKHLDLAGSRLIQDASEVNTKFSKSMVTTFFPVGELALGILADWHAHLESRLLYGPSDPLFPSTLVLPAGPAHEFVAAGLSKAHWTSASPVRQVLKDACALAGFQYFNPHSIRHALAQLGFRLCRGDNEALKAWSQNLGHTHMMTTLISYGEIPAHRQAEIIRGLSVDQSGSPAKTDPEATLEAIQKMIAASGLKSTR